MQGGRFLTCGVAAAGCTARCCPLPVEPDFAALAVATFSVSLTVDAAQAQRVPDTALRPAAAVTAGCGAGAEFCSGVVPVL